jgi:hypothetical protein
LYSLRALLLSSLIKWLSLVNPGGNMADPSSKNRNGISNAVDSVFAALGGTGLREEEGETYEDRSGNAPRSAPKDGQQYDAYEDAL